MASGQQVIDTILKAQEAASIKQVFGEPITNGDRTIIPVATVQHFFAFGWGGGPEETNELGQSVQMGGGGGGGGSGQARPVALITATPEGVQVEPIMDQTRIAIGGMVLVGWTFMQVLGTLRQITRRKR